MGAGASAEDQPSSKMPTGGRHSTTQLVHPTAEIDSAFHRYDKDNDNSVDVHELHKALEKLGMLPDSFQHTLEVMRRYDKDGNGTLQLKEFRVLAKKMMQEQATAEATFHKFDTNKSGRINLKELFGCLAQLGLATTGDQAKEIMQQFSLERSPTGSLGLEEFRKVVDRCRAFQSHCDTFRRYDEDRSNSIDVGELFRALTELGLITSERQARQVMVHFDADQTQGLDLDEFIKLADAMAVFRQFDVDKDGHISVHELHYALQALKVAASFDQTEGILKNFDRDGDGNLQLDEYLKLVTEIQARSGYVHVAFCNGTCGGLCNPAANGQQPIQAQGNAALASATPAKSQKQQLQPLPSKPRLPVAPVAAPVAVTAEEIEASFHRFDRDKDGSVDLHELHSALEALGVPPNNFLQTLETMHRYDTDKDGSLGLAEYRVLASEVLQLLQATEASFVQFDRDRDGRINANEAMYALNALGLKEVLGHAQQVMQQFSQDGSLQLPEYRKVAERCRTLQKHCSTFRRFDLDQSGKINDNELHGAMSELGLLTSLEQAREVLLRFDVDQSRDLDMGEFIRLVDTISSFRQFDKDGDGSLNAQELHYALGALRVPTANFQQTQELLRRFDRDGDKQLQVNEYLALVFEFQSKAAGR